MNSYREQYLESFQELMDEFYLALKKSGVMSREMIGFIDGFMSVGPLLGLTDYEELNSILEEANFRVFGMSITQRRRSIKRKQPNSLVDYLDFPTFIRQRKKIQI